MATIREKGPYQWHVQIRRKGWPNQTGTFRSKKDAQAWARNIESEMDRGQFVDRSGAQRATLDSLIDLYLVEVTDKRPSETSRGSERSRLERFQREEQELCAYSVINLTPEHFEDYRDRRLMQTVGQSGKTVAPGTVKRELTLLKRVIDYRKRRLGLLINPANTEDVVRPAVNDERDIRLTTEEKVKLLAECGKARNKFLLPFVEMGFETGARRGSLLSLTWDDVDLKNRMATLRGVKNSRNPETIINHSIGLSPRAIEVINALPRSDDEKRLFPITPNALRLAFNRARDRAGLPHFRFHDTRHERTSSLFEGGWSLIQVMAQTGHKDPKSVKRYTTLAKDYLADELEKLDKANAKKAKKKKSA